MQPLKYFHSWFLIGIGLVIGVIYLSLTPAAPKPFQVTFGDKIGHLLGYGALMLWFAQLYPSNRHAIIGVLFMLLGISLEFAQGASGYRSFEYADMVANTAGVLIGVALARSPAGALLSWLERRLGVR